MTAYLQHKVADSHLFIQISPLALFQTIYIRELAKFLQGRQKQISSGFRVM